MQMLTSLNTNVPAAAPKAPAAANTSARPAEESWVTDDGVSLSSADVAGGKANVPANGMHVTYKYDHGAMRDIKMGAICGFV
ncbi:MAG: hypothetical protein FJX76_21460, partial [Armatimonadetes bacterium]|nr:hypothetical protein [Armatimonadota bacterium]